MALSTKTKKYAHLPFAGGESLKDYQRIWLLEALGEQEAKTVFTLPRGLVESLYGDIFKYGPKADAVIAVKGAIRSRLNEMGWFSVTQDLGRETPFPAMAEFYQLGAHNLSMQSFNELMTNAWTREGQVIAFTHFNLLAGSITSGSYPYVALEKTIPVKHQLIHLVTAVGMSDLMPRSHKNRTLMKARDAALDEMGCLHAVS